MDAAGVTGVDQAEVSKELEAIDNILHDKIKALNQAKKNVGKVTSDDSPAAKKAHKVSHNKIDYDPDDAPYKKAGYKSLLCAGWTIGMCG